MGMGRGGRAKRGWGTVLLLVWLALHPPGPAAADPAPSRPAGPLVIAGGALADGNEGWARFVALAGGAGAPVLVIPTAGGTPESTGKRWSGHLAALGARADWIPLAADGPGAAVAEDPAWVARARAARGFWFTGGDQARITAALLRPDGSPTALLSAIRQAHAAGAVIGGSSAGAAIMSGTMFKDGPAPLDALRHGIEKGRHTDAGLGFIGGGWFVDQHFLARGRLGRLLVAMRDHGYRHGLGVEEDTALVAGPDGWAEVVGSGGVLLVDLSGADMPPGIPVRLSGVRLSFLAAGDRIDLATATVKPSQQKLDGTVIDPMAADFRPYYGDTPLWQADMLAPGVLVRALAHVVDSRAGMAEGLVFDRPDPTDPVTRVGFALTLTRGEGTRGWHASGTGPLGYTVLDVRLAVEPVLMAAPLTGPFPSAGP